MKTIKLFSLSAAVIFISAAVVSAQTAAQTAVSTTTAAGVRKAVNKTLKKKTPVKAGAKALPRAAAKPAAAAANPAASQPAAVQPSAPAVSSFDEAVSKLNSSDPVVRRQGADTLIRSRDHGAAPHLAKALSDSAPAVRAAAVDGLCQMAHRDSTEEITEILQKDPDASVRQQAAGSLSYMMDPAAGPALVAALKDPAIAVRYAAANTLGAMKYAPAEGALIDALSQADMHRIAISALGQLQSKKAAPAIAASLSDQDKYTKLEAVKALGTIGDSSFAADIKKLLDKAEDPSTRVEAALALSKFGMSDGLLTAYEFTSSPDLSLKNRALDVLSNVGDARSLQFIQDAYAAEKNPAVKSMYDFTRQRLSARLKIPLTLP